MRALGVRDVGNLRTISTYAPEFKAQIVAEYATGATDYALSKKYKMSRNTIKTWALEAGIERGQQIDDEARSILSRLLFTHLEESIKSMTAVVSIAQDREWLKAQGAGDLALFFSALNDKTVHLLASLEASNGADTDEDTEIYT